MSNFSKRRFVFIDFDNLKKVKFKKLEKVCDRVFILIDSKEQSIPFELVRQIQRLGKAVRWIPIDNPQDKNFNYHLAFLLGKFHQKISTDTEFAILSNDLMFDPLVSFINTQGRSCLRVRSKSVGGSEPKMSPNGNHPGSQPSEKKGEPSVDEAFNNGIIEMTADDTIRKLRTAKNRPDDLSELRQYIELHNEEFSKSGSVDKVIRQMQIKKKIAVRGGQVTYNLEE